MKEGRKINWKIVLSVISVGIAIISLLAIPPKTWWSSVIEWFSIIKSILLAILTLIIALLLLRVYILKQRLKEKEKVAVKGNPSKEFESLIEAHDILKTIIHEFSEMPGIQEIKVIGATGNTFLNIVKQYILPNHQIKNINFKLLLIDPTFPEINKISSHWGKEIEPVIKELNVMNEQFIKSGRNILFQWKFYNHLPTVHGIMFEDSRLLFGFFHWIEKGKKQELIGAEKPYIYLENKETRSKIFFETFKNWFDYNWKEESI